MPGPNYPWSVDFELLEAAKLYGATIDYMATLELSKVPVNEAGKLETIFVKSVHPLSATNGKYFRIEEIDQLDTVSPIYRVKYRICGPEGALLADVYRTIPVVEAQLNEIRDQLDGTNVPGRSR